MIAQVSWHARCRSTEVIALTPGVTMTADVARLQAQYRAGDYAAVAHAAVACLPGNHEYAAVMQLAGQANVRLGHDDDAVVCFLRAALDPAMRASAAQSACLFNAALSLRRADRLALAKHVLCCDLLLAPLRGVQRPSPLLLVDLLHGTPDLQLAVLATASGIPALRVECIDRLLRLLQAPAQSPSPIPCGDTDAVDVATAGTLLSVIVCSHRDGLFARCAAECERAFADSRFELIRIADAQSMCEGYQRGLKASTGELLVFMHDDVELLSPDFGIRLRRELANCDLLAIAGATHFEGPAWFSAGPDFLRGSVTVPRSDGKYALHWASLGVEYDPLAVADGFFLACHRRVATSVGWDIHPIPGFHGYDVDFTYRAGRAGFRVRAANSLQIAHASEGLFDDRWLGTSKAICTWLGVGFGPGTSPRWISASVASRKQATLLFDHVAACADSALSKIRTMLTAPGVVNGDTSLRGFGEVTELLQTLRETIDVVSSGNMGALQAGMTASPVRA